MDNRDARKFFIRFLLLTVLTFILASLSLAFVNMDGAGLWIGGIVVGINILLLLYFIVLAIYKLVKHILNKEKAYFDFMFVVNLLFTLLISVAFSSFYFVTLSSVLET